MKWLRGRPRAAPWIIVGLGNPGNRYADTRHNVGFMAIDQWAQRHGIDLSRKKSFAHVGEGNVPVLDAGDQRVIVAKPRTFMNASGDAVLELVRRYHGRPDRLVIVYDEMDLPTAKIRVRERGSAAGHKGILSIIECLGTDAFPRIRIGVARPAEGRGSVGHVLEAFTPEEAEAIRGAVARAGEALDYLITNGAERAMNEFNQG